MKMDIVLLKLESWQPVL